MKRRFLIVALLAAVMALALCACGQQGGSSASASADASASASAASSSAVSAAMEALPADKYKTLADAMSVQSNRTMWTYDDTHFIYAFKDDGKWVRVVADLPEDAHKQLVDMKMPEPGKVEELVGSFEVKQAEAFVDSEPAEEELQQFVGKTGADVVAAGYTLDSLTPQGGTTVVRAIKIPYAVRVTFDGAVENASTQDVAGAVKDMTVTEVMSEGPVFEVIRL